MACDGLQRAGTWSIDRVMPKAAVRAQAKKDKLDLRTALSRAAEVELQAAQRNEQAELRDTTDLLSEARVLLTEDRDLR